MHILKQAHSDFYLHTFDTCLVSKTRACARTMNSNSCVYDSVLHACKVDVLFHLARDDLRGCSAENVTFSHTLQVHFSTGAVQVH